MRHLFFILPAIIAGCAAPPRPPISGFELASNSQPDASVPTIEPAAPAGSPCDADCLKEQYAASLGLQAYLYGYPLVITDVYRRVMQASALRSGEVAAANRFHHFSKLLTPAVKSAVSANVDTLFSAAWVDLAGGPLVLHLPDSAGRYYVVQLNDFYSNSFAYLGQRTTGTQEQRYLLVGPDWKGGAPPGPEIIRCPTNGVFIAARIFVNGEKDVSNVTPIQERMTLQPVASTMPAPVTVNEGAIPLEQPTVVVAKMDAATFFTSMVYLMQRYRPPERDTVWLEQLRNIGIDLDHAFNPSALEAPTLRGLGRAMKTGEALLRGLGRQLSGSITNGWWIPGRAGDFGTDYVARAYMAMDFIWPNIPEEAVYAMGSLDALGKPLTGAHRYVLHFDPGQTPPVEAFWSVTMLNGRRSLVENSIHRYSIGSQTAGLKVGRDGSLDFFIQADVPRGRESNWLPAPKGEFVLTMRLYLPKREVLNGSYRIPPVWCIDCGY